MAAASSSSARTEFFAQLKELCVPLSRLAIREKDKTASAKEVLGLLEKLTTFWSDQAGRDEVVLDDKLADYAFFPITYILGNQAQYPVRVIEVTVTLIRSLIQYGWKKKISKDLAQQMLLFLTLVVGGNPGQEKGVKREVPEETILESLRTLNTLISIVGSSSASSLLAAEQSMVALGHTVSVILDQITEGANLEIQVAAADCIETLFTTTGIDNTLATFLPGIVSSLSKVLSPPLQPKVRRKVLMRCLDVLRAVLVKVLADLNTRSLLKETESSKPNKGETQPEDVQSTTTEAQKVLTPAWLKATTAQVKIALASVLKLRNHESEEIRWVLDRVCIALLDECHASLANCRSILVESAMVVESESTRKSVQDTSLQDLASIYPELRDDIKTTMYNWVTTLPRIMQASDEQIKQQALRNILNGSKLVTALRLDSSVLEDTLGDALRDSIVVTMRSAKSPKGLDEVATDMNVLTTSTELANSNAAVQVYHPVLLAQESQKSTREDMVALLSNIGSTALQTKLAADMLSYVRDSEGVDQIASYWLAFEILKANYAHSAELDSLLDLGGLDETENRSTVFRELLDFSVSVLSSHSDSAEAETDWRLEAIALEATAFAASQLKADFRPELIDVLYPVATFLGAPHPQLRAHAVTTLNGLAASCGYASVSELIVANADYMVNSVSLRLNTFDISPASTRVLTMMVRLTGPRLVPFLDDVVTAIFAALDNYHGYPVFVESLFSVLSEVVTQGVKSDMLLLEGGRSKTVDHRKRKRDPTSTEDILEMLEKRSERAKKSREEEGEEGAEGIIRGHPREPWGPGKRKGEEKPKTFLETLEEQEGKEGDNVNDDDALETNANTNNALEEKPKPPPTPTYSLLTRVATLTQHYLTSPTPTLRRSLLELIATVGPALAPDEETFLPLVHALWPVVITRLHDAEPFVVIAACRALASLCAAAGDFLASRFATEWWDGLGRWCRRARDEAATASGSKSAGRARHGNAAAADGKEILLIPGRSRPSTTTTTTLSVSASASASGLGRFAQPVQVWDAVVDLLTALVSFVRLDDAVFDEILDLLVDELPRRDPRVRAALDAINADAVWLALYERGREPVGASSVPSGVEGVVFAPLDLGRDEMVMSES